MVNGADRRVRRTRGALLRAFDELVLERSFARVTVNDIVARADVGRSTFYEHFGGKEDILEESVAQPLSLLVNAIEPGGDVEVLAMVEHLRKKSQLARGLLASSARHALTRVLARLIEERLTLRRYSARRGASMSTQHVAAMLAEIQVAMLDAWLSGRIECPAEELARSIVLSSNATATALLDGAR
jgi:AcrR family transcriptional regulator